MKKILNYLLEKNLIFKSFKEVLPKELGSRKKVTLFIGVDLKTYYTLVMIIEKKSRILQKEVEDFVGLHEKMELFIDSKITKKIILINAPLCHKAKALLKEKGWKVYLDFS